MVINVDKPGEGIKRARRTGKGRTATLAGPRDEEEIVVRTGEPRRGSLWSILQMGTVRQYEITNFLRQLIMLLDAGTPLLKSLKTLSHRGQSPAIRGLVSDIAQYVEGGNPLWQSFDRHPRYFDTVFVNLIKASEASGTLTTVLRRVTEYRQKRELLTKRVRGAMIYPALLVIACFGVLLLLTNFVVPQFGEMFVKQNIEIPRGTQIFLAASDFLRVWWWTPVLAVILLVALYKAWFVRNPLRRLWADRIKLRIPITGPIVHKNAIVELTRTMSLLLRSGLSMMATLDLTRNAIHNRAVALSLQAVRDSVEQGGGLEAPLRASSDVIPAVVTDMFVTGEEAGSVDKIAEQIADVYEEEVKIAVDGLGEALQPVFTIIIGLVIIVLFVSLFYPIISMIENISGGA
jgi:type IV pilus assembly protein PilC